MPEHTRAALKISELAATYGVSQQTIRAAIKSGALKAKNIGEGTDRVHVRVAAKDAQAWFAALPDA